MLASVDHNPRRSVRKHVQASGMYDINIWRILRAGMQSPVAQQWPRQGEALAILSAVSGIRGW
jgi:hypothetical protein